MDTGLSEICKPAEKRKKLLSARLVLLYAAQVARAPIHRLPLNGSEKMTWSPRLRTIFSKAWDNARGADHSAIGRESELMLTTSLMTGCSVRCGAKTGRMSMSPASGIGIYRCSCASPRVEECGQGRLQLRNVQWLFGGKSGSAARGRLQLSWSGLSERVTYSCGGCWPQRGTGGAMLEVIGRAMAKCQVS